MRRLGLFLGLLAFLVAAPLGSQAQAASVSQTITITAYVAPARSIIIDDQNRMKTIFSNTDQNVTPKVFIDSTQGKQMPLTKALHDKYDKIMANQSKVIGVEIPVELPKADDDSVNRVLFGKISTFLMKF